MMKILVIGGTGTVGSEVVRSLLSRKTKVLVLTRSEDKTKELPSGAEGVVGDLLDPETVRSVFRDVDGVFLLVGVTTTETHAGLMAVNGMRMAEVRRVVYMSVHRLEEALHLPHFGSKLPIEAVLKSSAIPCTILRPNNFFQNDYQLKDAILMHGVYPQPLGEVGLSRVDVRDIAEAAAIALTEPGHEGQTYNLVGPDVLTGSSTAEIWSRALGRTIAYGGDDLDAWEKQVLGFLPPWMAFDFRLMYAFFQDRGLQADPSDIERLKKLLGRSPRKFEDFAVETARKWRS
jgi:uncharacterized protein YbjT (DUF2867 family)